MKTWAILLFLLPHLALAAQSVVPRDTVTSYVTIRASDPTDSEKLGELTPGESLPYRDSVPRWHIRTYLNHERMRDHIICRKADGEFDCQYKADIEIN